MNATSARPRLSVTTGGKGAVAHVGARLLCDLADAVGLSEGLSATMAPTKARRRGWDRGRVLVDLAVAIADGATTISDLAVLRNQPSLFGEVASLATAWRTLEAVDDAVLERLASARAKARAAAWEAGADPGYYVIDIDATLVDAHSDKEGAAPTYKHGFGYHPLMAYLDATGEPLAGLLRPGNAGAGAADDMVAVLDAALGQLPVDPAADEVIVRADAAGLSHHFVDAARARRVSFCVGHRLTAELAAAVTALPERAWQPAITSDGSDEREGAEVAELTGSLDLSRWPPGTRAIARREHVHPGAQLTFTDIDGHRFQVFFTDMADGIAFCEATYRGRGRAECAIRDAKDSGLAHLPSSEQAINAAWVALVLIAGDLLAWARALCLDGELARAQPARLRYTLLHTAGVVVTSARRTTVRIAEGWPWADELVRAFARLPGWSLVT
jgi:hypothetical protein